MAKKWFHCAIPMFLELDESWVKERISQTYNIDLPEEMLDGIADMVKKHLIPDSKMLIYTQTKILPTKTSPYELITTVPKKEYDFHKK